MRSSLRRLNRILPWLQTGWSILGVTLVLVVLLELGLRGVFWLKDRWKPQIPPDPRVVSAVRDGAAWLRRHYRELEALSDRWQPYVYFRQRPFPGQTITIERTGCGRPGSHRQGRAMTRRATAQDPHARRLVALGFRCPR